MSPNIYSIILKLFGQITLHEDILVQYNFNPLIPSGLDKESLLIQTLPKLVPEIILRPDLPSQNMYLNTRNFLEKIK